MGRGGHRPGPPEPEERGRPGFERRSRSAGRPADSGSRRLVRAGWLGTPWQGRPRIGRPNERHGRRPPPGGRIGHLGPRCGAGRAGLRRRLRPTHADPRLQDRFHGPGVLLGPRRHLRGSRDVVHVPRGSTTDLARQPHRHGAAGGFRHGRAPAGPHTAPGARRAPGGDRDARTRSAALTGQEPVGAGPLGGPLPRLAPSGPGARLDPVERRRRRGFVVPLGARFHARTRRDAPTTSSARPAARPPGPRRPSCRRRSWGRCHGATRAAPCCP